MNSANNYDFPQSAPSSGVWPFVNNIYAESLINVLHESVFHVNEPNSVLKSATKIVGTWKYFMQAATFFRAVSLPLTMTISYLVRYEFF